MLLQGPIEYYSFFYGPSSLQRPQRQRYFIIKLVDIQCCIFLHQAKLIPCFKEISFSGSLKRANVSHYFWGASYLKPPEHQPVFRKHTNEINFKPDYCTSMERAQPEFP